MLYVENIYKFLRIAVVNHLLSFLCVKCPAIVFLGTLFSEQYLRFWYYKHIQRAMDYLTLSLIVISLFRIGMFAI